MVSRWMLLVVFVLLVFAFFYYNFDSVEEETDTPPNTYSSLKDYIYVPIECMINASYYNVKCYEDSLNG